MNDSANVVLQTVSSILDELGTRFGSTGAHLWEQLVRSELATAWTIIVMLSGAWVISGLVLLWGLKENEEDLMGIGGTGFCIISLASLFIFPWAISALIAPEAAVLKGLLP